MKKPALHIQDASEVSEISLRRDEGPGISGGSSLFTGIYLQQLLPVMLILMFSVVTIWSASLTISEANFRNHLIGIVIGLFVGGIIWSLDCRVFSNLTPFLFVATCVLFVLPYIPGLGVEGGLGSVAWVKLGPITFQPSEPGKLSTIFLMAAAAAEYNGKIASLKDYVKLCFLLAVPVLIITSYDLGTGIVVFVLGACVIACSGAPKIWILNTFLLTVLLIALVVISSTIDGLPHILKEYQLKRLTVFLDPASDTTDDGYNLLQSKIAVGSGGLFGKGVGNATQASGGFLPEAHTDFVFALFSEEFGFIGAITLILLFACMIFSSLVLAIRCDYLFFKLLLVGCAAMWTFQVFENVGMCLGIMPITGIPLPFMSYGSSSMVAQLACVGAVQSVYRHMQKTR